MLNKIIAVTFFVVSGNSCFAAMDIPNQVSIPASYKGTENPSTNGNLCPKNTAQASLSSNLKSIVVNYNQMLLNLEGKGKKENESCNMSLAIDAPAGYSYAIKKIEYKTNFQISSFSELQLNSLNYFVPNSDRVGYSKIYDANSNAKLTGPFAASQILSEEINDDKMIWLPCGTKYPIKINTDIMAKSDDKKENSFVKLSLVQAIYTIEWRKCVILD